jgi:uncharacterized protein YrrD
MKRRTKSLIGNAIGATDGEIGKVTEFYFDDETWTVRYLIVETGSWLFGRKVLISPQAVLSADWENDVFQVNLTKEQIKNSPDIDTEKPVSRQQETKLYQYYPWNNYWDGGLGTSGIGMSYPIFIQPPAAEDVSVEHSEYNPHLRSTHQVTGYSIQAIDGEIGDVEDFIIDDTTWKIDFIEIDTGNWLPGKKVVLSPKLIKEIKWSSSAVIVNTSVAHVKNSPEYHPGQQINDTYEMDLQNHYGSFISHNQ